MTAIKPNYIVTVIHSREAANLFDTDCHVHVDKKNEYWSVYDKTVNCKDCRARMKLLPMDEAEIMFILIQGSIQKMPELATADQILAVVEEVYNKYHEYMGKE